MILQVAGLSEVTTSSTEEVLFPHSFSSSAELFSSFWSTIYIAPLLAEPSIKSMKQYQVMRLLTKGNRERTQEPTKVKTLDLIVQLTELSRNCQMLHKSKSTSLSYCCQHVSAQSIVLFVALPVSCKHFVQTNYIMILFTNQQTKNGISKRYSWNITFLLDRQGKNFPILSTDRVALSKNTSCPL